MRRCIALLVIGLPSEDLVDDKYTRKLTRLIPETSPRTGEKSDALLCPFAIKTADRESKPPLESQ
jgi:hypothetical protein